MFLSVRYWGLQNQEKSAGINATYTSQTETGEIGRNTVGGEWEKWYVAEKSEKRCIPVGLIGCQCCTNFSEFPS